MNFDDVIRSYKECPTFKCWCALTVPTIFGQGMDYYEQLCKLAYLLEKFEQETGKNFDSVNMAIQAIIKEIQGWKPDAIEKYLDELVADGTMGKLLSGVFADYNFLDTFDYSPAFQNVFQDNESACQGMCTGIWNGVPFIAMCNRTADNTNGRMNIVNINTGQLMQTTTSSMYHHMNDITFCPKDNCIYIANGQSDDLNGIVVYNLDTQAVTLKEFTLPNFSNFQGIAWDDDEQLFIGYARYNNQAVFFKIDYNFTTPFTISQPVSVNYSRIYNQGIAYHNGLIFHAMGKAWNSNESNGVGKVCIYNSLNFEFVSAIINPVYDELQAVDFYNGEIFLYMKTNYAGVVGRGAYLKSRNMYTNQLNISHVNINIYNANITVYLSNDKQFIIDGTINYPYYGQSFIPFLNYRQINNLTFYLVTDFGTPSNPIGMGWYNSPYEPKKITFNLNGKKYYGAIKSETDVLTVQNGDIYYYSTLRDYPLDSQWGLLTLSDVNFHNCGNAPFLYSRGRCNISNVTHDCTGIASVDANFFTFIRCSNTRIWSDHGVQISSYDGVQNGLSGENNYNLYSSTLPVNVDFNTIIQAGTYSIPEGDHVNAPNNQSLKLYVDQYGHSGRQLIIADRNSFSGYTQIYERNFSIGDFVNPVVTWGVWHELPTRGIRSTRQLTPTDPYTMGTSNIVDIQYPDIFIRADIVIGGNTIPYNTVIATIPNIPYPQGTWTNILARIRLQDGPRDNQLIQVNQTNDIINLRYIGNETLNIAGITIVWGSHRITQ